MFKELVSMYPLITIPGKVCIKNNAPNLTCIPVKNFSPKPKKACGGAMRPTQCGRRGLSESETNVIAIYMSRCWGLPAITTAVNLKFRFYIPRFPGKPIFDMDNAYKGYQDIMQEVHILENDRLVQGHDGSRIVYMCHTCEAKTKGGNRGKSCPGAQKCPGQKTTIQITDVTLDWTGVYL